MRSFVSVSTFFFFFFCPVCFFFLHSYPAVIWKQTKNVWIDLAMEHIEQVNSKIRISFHLNSTCHFFQEILDDTRISNKKQTQNVFRLVLVVDAEQIRLFILGRGYLSTWSFSKLLKFHRFSFKYVEAKSWSFKCDSFNPLGLFFHKLKTAATSC